jgi:hypothetical protein
MSNGRKATGDQRPAIRKQEKQRRSLELKLPTTLRDSEHARMPGLRVLFGEEENAKLEECIKVGETGAGGERVR